MENHFASESPLRNGAKVRPRLERGYYSNRARNQISHTPMTLLRDALRETAGNNNIEENAHTHTHSQCVMDVMSTRRYYYPLYATDRTTPCLPGARCVTAARARVLQLPSNSLRKIHTPIAMYWGRCNGRDSGRRQYQTTDCCARLGGPIFLAHVQNAIGHVRPLPRPRPHSLHVFPPFPGAASSSGGTTKKSLGFEQISHKSTENATPEASFPKAPPPLPNNNH